MQGLQQFEARHKEAQRGVREGAGGTGRRDRETEREGEDGFRQQALAFYKSDSGINSSGGGYGMESAQKAALAAQLDRERRRAAAKEREQRLIQTF